MSPKAPFFRKTQILIMNLALYSAASGMESQQQNLNTISNNIANVNTTGFKRSKAEFQDLLYQSAKPAGGDAGAGNVIPTSVELGNGSQLVSTTKVFSQGQLSETNGQLDVAIQGEGFFEVRRSDGSRAFTRDGAFKVDGNGTVTTSSGLPVQNFPAIPPRSQSIFISTTGEITVSNGTNQTPLGQIQLIRFVNPGGLESLGGNLLAETNASGVPETGNVGQNGFGSLRQGYLEMSNVNVVQEMVNMIIAQRAYEINSKAIQSSDDMLRQVSTLKR
jgi:flagellar basal-body rod protein FlgG